jgi:hypothetical protein
MKIKKYLLKQTNFKKEKFFEFQIINNQIKYMLKLFITSLTLNFVIRIQSLSTFYINIRESKNILYVCGIAIDAVFYAF